MTSESNTPGAAGTATEGEFETGQVPPIDYHRRASWANPEAHMQTATPSIISATEMAARLNGTYFVNRHASAIRAIEHALTLDSEAAWWQAATVLSVRLSRRERAALAFSCLAAQDHVDAHRTAEALLFKTPRAGSWA